MNPDKPIAEYMTKFREYKAFLKWHDSAFHYQFHRGLASRIKNHLVFREKTKTLEELMTAAQEADIRHWERQREIQREKARKPPPAHNPPKSAPSGNTSGTPANHSGSNNQGRGSNRNQGRQYNPAPKPSSSGSSSNHSSNNSGNSSSTFLSGKLGKDGKLTPEERQRRFDNKLCMFCAKPGHVAKDCKKATSSAAKARAASAPVSAPAEPEPEKA